MKTLAFCKIAQCQHKIGDSSRAKRSSIVALTTAFKIVNPKKKTLMFLKIAQLQSKLGETDRARESSIYATMAMHAISDQKKQIHALNRIFKFQYKFDYLELALKTLSILNQKFSAITFDLSFEVKQNIKMSCFYAQLRKIDTARSLLTIAQLHVLDLSILQKKEIYLKKIAIEEARWGEIKWSHFYVSEINDEKLKMKTLFSIGKIEYKRFNQCIKTLNILKKITSQNNDAYVFIALLQAKTKKIVSALRCLLLIKECDQLLKAYSKMEKYLKKAHLNWTVLRDLISKDPSLCSLNEKFNGYTINNPLYKIEAYTKAKRYTAAILIASSLSSKAQRIVGLVTISKNLMRDGRLEIAKSTIQLAHDTLRFVPNPRLAIKVLRQQAYLGLVENCNHALYWIYCHAHLNARTWISVAKVAAINGNWRLAQNLIFKHLIRKGENPPAIEIFIAFAKKFNSPYA